MKKYQLRKVGSTYIIEKVIEISPWCEELTINQFRELLDAESNGEIDIIAIPSYIGRELKRK